MTSGNDFDATLFAARLTPHRSLNRTAFIALMIFLSTVSFAAGVVFLLIGAWPVLGFFGLDVLAIYWAFRVNFRHARAYEDISVSYSELRVRRVSHRGHVMEWVLNPLWVQVDRKTHLDRNPSPHTGEQPAPGCPDSASEFGTERLYLVSRGRRISVAGFLGPDEKDSFYKALTAALAEARRGPTFNPASS